MRDDGLSLNAQILIADINIHMLGSQFYNNPWKLAWTVGGRKETSLGSFGFYHGGALRYTFEPITTASASELPMTAYGYTYYPDTRFDASNDESGDYESLAIEDNSIGYKYGENNIAFQFDWKKHAERLRFVCGTFEYRLSGTNSPSTPWGRLAQSSERHCAP